MADLDTLDSDLETGGDDPFAEYAEQARIDDGDGSDESSAATPDEGERDALETDESRPSRDARGRFNAQDPTDPADPNAAPLVEDEGLQDDAHAGEDEGDAEFDALLEALPEPEPFTVNADGQPTTIEGVEYYPGIGAVVADDQFARLQELASRGLHHEHMVRELTDQRRQLAEQWQVLEDTRKSPSEDVIAAQTVMRALQGINDQVIGSIMAHPMGPEAGIKAYFQHVARMGLDAATQAELKRYRDASKARVESTQTEELGHWQRSTLKSVIGQMVKDDPSLAVLTPQEQDRLHARLSNYLGALWKQQNGQWFYDDRAIMQELRDRADVLQTAAATAARTRDAQRFNQGVNNQPRRQQPARGQQPRRVPQRQQPVTRRQQVKAAEAAFARSLRGDDEDE